MKNLDIRLNAVYNMVDKCNTFLDVGTDHGYLPIELIKNNKIKNAVVSDVNVGPLDNAKDNFKSNNLMDRAKFVLTDGLRDIDASVIDAVSICGMGGELILNILKNDEVKVKCFEYIVLQPMNSVDLVRRYLYENGFTIVDEDLVKDKKHFYNVLKVVPKKDDKIYDDIFFDLGYELFNKGNDKFIEFINYKINVRKKIIKNCENNHSDNANRAIKKSLDYINILKGVKESYESKRCNKIY